jgi:hypothetical protein
MHLSEVYPRHKQLTTVCVLPGTRHLLDNELIQDSQHGFMPGKSCATNLVEFMDFVTKAVDERKPIVIFYLDFAKALDKVPRQKLVKR